MGVIRDKAVLVMSFPRKPPLQSSFPRPALDPGLFHKPNPVCGGPALVQPPGPQYGAVVCVGPWGVNKSPGGWPAAPSQGLRLVPQSPTTQLCGLTHQLVHSVHRHLLWIRCRAGSVTGTGSSTVNRQGFCSHAVCSGWGEGRKGHRHVGKHLGLVSDGAEEHSFRVLAFPLRPD